MNRLTARAFAKLNLYLDITGRRADGYHLLETVMRSISLHDIVTVVLKPGSGISVECRREDVPADRRNTAYRAAELFLQQTGNSVRVDISIEKHIPSGAGLGGGSADAAAVLVCMNTAFGEPLSADEMRDIAAQVGADVPFCLVGGTKLCRGIGEVISDIPGDMSEKYYLVVKPEHSCPTGEAYRSYDQSPPAVHGGLERLCRALSGDFAPEMYNVFQQLYADERINSLCSLLTECGARGAVLTGSGSAVFGVFEDCNAAKAAAAKLPGGCFKELCTASGSGGVEIIGMEGNRL